MTRESLKQKLIDLADEAGTDFPAVKAILLSLAASVIIHDEHDMMVYVTFYTKLMLKHIGKTKRAM